MTEFVFIGILPVAILCALDLRLGMCLTLVAGFLQDPLRKVVADSPVYFSAIVLLFAAATFVGGLLSGSIRPFGSVPGWNVRLKGPVLLFIAVVALQSLMSFIYTGSVFLSGIGLLVYLAPFPALLLAYSYASSFARLRLFFWLYVIVTAAMVSGVYLVWLGVDLELLQSVGDPLVVYSLESGEPLELPAGFLRTPEVSAWHAASGACIALMLGLSARRRHAGIVSVALALFFVGAVMLTGRRKFLLEIAMYLPALWFLLWRFRLAAGRLLYLLFALALSGLVVVVTGLAESNTREAFQAPVARGQDRTDEVIERIVNVTVGAFPHVYEANGFFGSGAGSGSGGAQYYGGGDERVGLAAEGGLGKVLAELGVPGFLLVIWLGMRLLAQVRGSLVLVAQGPPDAALLTMGIAAFLLSNMVVFVGAHQVYSDPFILLFLGSCLGFILASHRMVEPGRHPGGQWTPQALRRHPGLLQS